VLCLSSSTADDARTVLPQPGLPTIGKLDLSEPYDGL